VQNPMVAKIANRLQDGIALARRKGATAAKIGFHHGESTNCSFEAGRLKETTDKESMGYSIEVIVGLQKANTSGNRLEKLEKMIEDAVALAKVGSAAHFEAYPAPTPITRVKTHSKRTLALSRDKMIGACQQMTDA
jgi:predicted Zn-dependent protease